MSADFCPAPFTVSVSHLMKDKSADEAFKVLQGFCESKQLVDFTQTEGFSEPSFQVNRNSVVGNLVYDRFFGALHEIVVEQGKDARLEIVFHGTRAGNVEQILENGLDPSRRRGQAYGPGEYFSRRPRESLFYCHNGNQMLVFCVVVPEATTGPMQTWRPAPTGFTMQTGGFTMQTWRIPPSYVVVPTGSHQLPLGILQFSGATQEVHDQSRKAFLQLQNLRYEVSRRQSRANEAKMRAELIQLLILRDIDLAGSKYQRWKSKLSHRSIHEIATYANRLFESDVVTFYFPDMEKSMRAAQQERAEILQSVEATETDLSQAQKRLNKALKDLRRSGQATQAATGAFINQQTLAPLAQPPQAATGAFINQQTLAPLAQPTQAATGAFIYQQTLAPLAQP